VRGLSNVSRARVVDAQAPKRVDRYKDPVDGRRVSLEVYSDEPYVAVLRDYLSLEACKQLEGEATKAGLKSATVLDGAGAGGGVAGERRAKQATIPRGALSSRLVERAAAVGEKIVGYELRGSAAFQEPLAFVEYDAGSEYAAHADGAASGAYVTGGRVASVVHYCAAPSSGGLCGNQPVERPVQQKLQTSLARSHRSRFG
jgi:hypothetical protein